MKYLKVKHNGDITDEVLEHYMVDNCLLDNKENKMTKILKWLSGKKSIIAGLITTTSAFLALKGVITPEDATYINAISLIFFGSASVATTRMYNNK